MHLSFIQTGVPKEKYIDLIERVGSYDGIQGNENAYPYLYISIVKNVMKESIFIVHVVLLRLSMSLILSN